MRAAILVLSLFLAFNATAYNHGVLGRIYPINEVDLIEFIQNQLRQKEKSGELAGSPRTGRARLRARPVGAASLRADRNRPLGPALPMRTSRKGCPCD